MRRCLHPEANLQRNNPSIPEYDYSRVGYARRHAIRTLDDYNCSSQEIMAMFGVSKSTFYRYDRDVRLMRRPAQTDCLHSMPPKDAREIVVISLIRAEFKVKEIAQALGATITWVYRKRDAFQKRLGETSPAERNQLHRYLKHAIRDTLSPPERALEARRRRKRWISGARRFAS